MGEIFANIRGTVQIYNITVLIDPIVIFDIIHCRIHV